MKRYQTLLFDADGTLFDYDAAEAEALEQTFLEWNLEFSEDILQKYREINGYLWKQFELGKVTVTELQLGRFRDLFQTLSCKADVPSFNDRYLEKLGGICRLMEGAEEVCHTLKKIYPMVIITNGVTATQHRRLSVSAIKDCFSHLFISEEMGVAKPKKEYFDHVLQTLRLRKEDVLIIGDSLTSDILGGINSGIDTVWVSHGKKNPYDFKPSYEINTLRELLPLLEKTDR